ncbi:hypothetical protein AXG93_4278s1180 [Marchantia polymorpha subsp. ruderalis]|uniref:RRM domain-containing protein n=1 Tax=Marchantia polymorpha subsp. ruderalis TaxID=1480154 RepID=A0A176W245_MARPO|nr:hypothetical protein AXG93_4278s1180 [Marchantia polymorpha subsp. ruderalis]
MVQNSYSADELLNRRVFVGGLSPFVDSDDLKEAFEENFGPVVSAVVIKNHASAQVHSRGFGFVTFKHESSASSAVHAHYAQIFGRKVEIKSAIARHHLGNAEEVSNSEHQESAEVLKESDTLPPTPASCSSEDLTQRWNPDVWVPRFKQWLPKFLSEVSNRLKGGEWYPMSSLKGDFRATCGLELDHKGIGYMKLNDFLRTLPELCKMKIAPVGLGHATQIVLLPAKKRMITWHTHGLKTEEINSESPTASLVETGLSYPAVKYEGSARNTNIKDAAAACTCSELSSTKESADNFTSASTHPQSAGSPNMRASVISSGSQNGASTEPQNICSLELNYLRERIILLQDIVAKQNEILCKDSWWNKRGPVFINGSNVYDNTSNAFGNPEIFGRFPDSLDSSFCQDPYNSMRLSTNTPGTSSKVELTSAVKDVRDHEATNLLNYEESSAPYILWGQNLTNIQDRPNILGQYLAPEYGELEVRNDT